MNEVFNFLEFDSRIRIRSPSSLIIHSILLVDCNEWATVARGDVCGHVSLRASLSVRSCFLAFYPGFTFYIKSVVFKKYVYIILYLIYL